jgi:hypothetical protein
MKKEQTNAPLQLALDQMGKSDLISLVIEIEQINSINPKDNREQINQVMLDRIPGYVFI